MKIQFRYRSMVLAALAISLLAIAGFPQTAWAGNENNARAEQAAEKKAEAKGQQAKPSDDSQPSAGTPTAGDLDAQEGATTHDGGNGPGGQTCDGDPDGSSDGGTGANGNGEYYDDTCATTDQTVAAPNGAGAGEATGKPAEGSVGNADDKTPAGQFNSGPNDHNNGYECDEKGRTANEGNNGVGFGNPAHTGCTPDDSTDCVPTTANQNCGTDCVPTTTNQNCGTDCVPTAANNQCRPCPEGQNMGANGKCDCPSTEVMGADATCTKPCVAGDGNPVCNQVTETCVASSGNERCGGVAAAAVLGEQLGRLEVLGVSIEAPTGAVAPAALARTGGFGLTALIQAGLILAMVGLGLTVMSRRRLQMVDIASRISGR